MTGPEHAPADEAPNWRDDVTLGQKIAGGLMILNGVIVLLERAMLPETGGALSETPTAGISAAIIDIVIGGALLNNNSKVVTLAIIRVGLGLVLFGLMFLAKNDVLMAVFQVAVSASLAMLLIGRAGRARITAACVLFSGYVFMEGLGAYVIKTGHNPLGATFASLRGDLDGPAGEVVGISSDYRIRAPSGDWYLRDRQAAKLDNPLADQWLMLPSLDAHVAVIDEYVAGAAMPVDLLTTAVLDNLRGAASGFSDLGTEPMAKFPGNGRLLHVRGRIGGEDVEALIAVISVYEHSFQVMALAPQRNFARVEGDLRAAIDSFTPPAVQASAPADAEPVADGKVTGLKLPYSLAAPSEQWFLRKTEAAQRDNPDADRWLVRPDRDAHVYVIAEQLADPELDVDRYTIAVELMIRGALQSVEFEPRRALGGDPSRGNMFHVRGAVDGMALEYDYAVVVAGGYGFQIVGFSRKEFYPDVKDDLLRALESFAPPPAK